MHCNSVGISNHAFINFYRHFKFRNYYEEEGLRLLLQIQYGTTIVIQNDYYR